MNLQSNDNPVAKALAAARRDPKKASVLLGLVVLMGFMWLRVAMKSDPFPASAGASTVAAVTPTSAVEPSFPRRSDATVAAFRDWTHNPIGSLGRNMFAVKLDYYPQDGSQVATLRVPAGSGFWDQVAKSMTARADQKKERRIFVENLQLQAAQLKLQTTLMGAHPRAMINGELVGEGNTIASFRVVKIDARRIVVEREGVMLEIQMN